jgi:5-methylcytosine-specific restriction enzyme A
MTNPSRTGATARGYGYKWQKAREWFLRANPLCCYCRAEGMLTPASVVDHTVPHRGDPGLFWDQDNWQPLCKPCHDTTKAREERGSTRRPAIGRDGWPVGVGASDR